MKNYKIVLQYEGTKYHGWQKQGNTQNTIQEKLENVLSRLDNRKVEVNGAGRTDAGTHAKGQVANFFLETEPKPERVMEYLNTYLPDDIGVTQIEEADLRFHSRLNAKKKTYMYRLRTSGIPNVLERKFYAEYNKELDTKLMKEAAELFIGRHNFKAFCANKNIKKSTERTLYSFEIEEACGELRFIVCGSGFLHHMVRIMVGTLCEVGSGERKIDSINELLEGGERSLAGETMPSKGLMLMNIEY